MSSNDEELGEQSKLLPVTLDSKENLKSSSRSNFTSLLFSYKFIGSLALFGLLILAVISRPQESLVNSNESVPIKANNFAGLVNPTLSPTRKPSAKPTAKPTAKPSPVPTPISSAYPTVKPTLNPTTQVPTFSDTVHFKTRWYTVGEGSATPNPFCAVFADKDLTVLPQGTSVVIYEICMDLSLVSFNINFQTFLKYGFGDNNQNSLLAYVQLSPGMYVKLFNGQNFQNSMPARSFTRTSPIKLSNEYFSSGGIPMLSNVHSAKLSLNPLPTLSPTPRPSSLPTISPTFRPTAAPSPLPTFYPTETTVYPLITWCGGDPPIVVQPGCAAFSKDSIIQDKSAMPVGKCTKVFYVCAQFSDGPSQISVPTNTLVTQNLVGSKLNYATLSYVFTGAGTTATIYTGISDSSGKPTGFSKTYLPNQQVSLVSEFFTAADGKYYSFNDNVYALSVSVVSTKPTLSPTLQPSATPTLSPTDSPTLSPTPVPSTAPTASPTPEPTLSPTKSPTPNPTSNPSLTPISEPTFTPTLVPISNPTPNPTTNPTFSPTLSPTTEPTASPTLMPSASPTLSPTFAPSAEPTVSPTLSPTVEPTVSPTLSPTTEPTVSPTLSPTVEPTVSPTLSPTVEPSASPTLSPTVEPSASPTLSPIAEPTVSPTLSPISDPTMTPTLSPTVEPTVAPTLSPIAEPTVSPTFSPSAEPTPSPTLIPAVEPTVSPTLSPTAEPTALPTDKCGPKCPAETYTLGDRLTAHDGCVVFAKHVLKDLGTTGLPPTTSPMFKVCTDPTCGPRIVTPNDLAYYVDGTVSFAMLGQGTKVEMFYSADFNGAYYEVDFKAFSDNVIDLTGEMFTNWVLVNDAVHSIRITSTSETKGCYVD